MELTTQKQDQLVALCQNLISIPSVTGQEEKLALFIREKCWGWDLIKPGLMTWET